MGGGHVSASKNLHGGSNGILFFFFFFSFLLAPRTQGRENGTETPAQKAQPKAEEFFLGLAFWT